MPKTAAPKRLTDEQSRIVAENIGLAYKAAFERAKCRPWRSEDLLDGAIDGLIAAALAFDGSRGHRFSTLAWKAIQNGITGRLRYLSREKRCGDAAIVQLDEDLADSDSLSVGPRLPDESPDFEGLISPLDSRRRHILRCRYQEGRTLQDVGEELGITREWVNKLQASAEEKLRMNLTA